ncbi:MAG TPA: CoA pyrophosphatase [Syntrophobacteraceae bacterium]|nr:CoA pyrophosphatase [Syntrophobacteraceae bacterium]
MNLPLLDDSHALQSLIIELLSRKCGCESLLKNEPCEGVRSSSVLLLLGRKVVGPSGTREICLILNKRSRRVRQAGDLCCPGGTMEGPLDLQLARLLTLPGSPLTRWPHWRHLRVHSPEEAELLSQLLATGLREGWEEMRLAPLGLRFLGPLPSQCLLAFRRVIHPMVGWVSWQKRFFPSWEVEKIVWIPLRSLLDESRYARYHLYVPPELEKRFNRRTQDYHCFVHPDGGTRELLWGATFRIVTNLVNLLFGFRPPPLNSLPLISGVLDEGYVYGRDHETGIGGKRDRGR